MPRVAAVILAAGGSMRMGRPKQLLVFKGRSLLRRAAEASLAVGCELVVVVLGRDVDLLTPELAGLAVEPIFNAEWERGLGTSIRHGVRRVLERSPNVDAIAILLADQPLVDAAELERLFDAFDRAAKPACASAYAGTVGPPVVVGRPFFPRLLALPDDRGAKAIWAREPAAVALHPCDAAAFDVDTPADYARLTEPQLTGGSHP